MYGPLPAKMCRNVLLCVDVDIIDTKKMIIRSKGGGQCLLVSKILLQRGR